jgi:hypothetical protein
VAAMPPKEDAAEQSMILAAIEKTGFPHENRTAQAFIEAGWSLVTNKYYVDDLSGEVREIDLIAYKVHKLDEYSIYSAVVISCKRTSDNKWVFITRPAKPSDPNVNSTPLHFWTSDPAIEYALSQDGFPKAFNEALSADSPSIWGTPKREIFGFQELVPAWKTKSGTDSELTHFNTNNDRALFSSIKSLMKAQAYELGRLPTRWKKPVVYVFSLLSVMDGDMVEVTYDPKGTAVSATALQNYIANYIITGKEQFSRINFVHTSALRRVIGELDKAHDNARAEIEAARKSFFSTVLDSWAQQSVLIPAFTKKLLFLINLYGRFRGDHEAKANSIGLEYLKEKKTLEIQLSNTVDDGAINKLNDSDVLRERTAQALKEIFKYEGEFRYAFDIPF